MFQDTSSTHTSGQASARLRVAVLLGGNTAEREISLESGRNIIYKLSPHKYIAVPIFVDDHMHLYRLTHAQLVRGSTKEIASTLQACDRIGWQDLTSIADFVFIGLHGGKGENGAVQGALEMLGMPYNGSSVLASALCMDKYRTAQYLAMHGFDVPRSLLIEQQTWIQDHAALVDRIEQEIGLPCIVKPHDDGCSVLVSKIDTAALLDTTINDFFSTGRTQVMVEEYINGMELTVGVIGNHTAQALPPSYAVACGQVLSIQEKFLPGAGENITPAPLPHEDLVYVQEVMKTAYQTIGCKGYARIDCFFQDATISPTSKKRVIILEINSLPGMTPATCIFHQAAEIGMRPMDFIDRIITLGLEEHSTNQVVDDLPVMPDELRSKPEKACYAKK